MSGVRVLVGTRKGAFVLTSDGTGERRRLLRLFACAEDLSFSRPDAPLPDAVARGGEPFIILGAIAGG
jgi:molybdopterin synthase sulfur carrier subunit